MLALLRARRDAFILPTAYFLLLLFLYGSISGLQYSRKGLGSLSVSHGTNYAEIANSTHTELQALIQQGVDTSDFAGMADRVALFSRLADAITQDRSLDYQPLVALLRQQFHWWEPAWSIYAPWNPQRWIKTRNTGIVICAGAHNFIYAGHLIRTLRNTLKSKLPIEIAYSGEADLPFANRAALKALDSNIEMLNLLDYFDDHIAGLQDGGFAQKPFAMLASRFQKVILLDADIIFLQKPDQMFETEPGLAETGTLFWHDRAFVQTDDSSTDRHSWFRGLMNGREPSSMLKKSLFWTQHMYHEMESGAVCMDKGRPAVFMSLVFATWMNTREARGITYAHTYGDKEAFWMAAELSGAAYHFNPTYGGIMGYKLRRDAKVCGSQLLHLDARNKPLWLNSSLRKNKHNGGSREFATLTHWMAPGYNMSQQIGWDFGMEEGVDWCAHGGDIVEMSWEETRIVDHMIGVSSRVDILLLPPPPERIDKEEKAAQEEKESKEKEEKEKEKEQEEKEDAEKGEEEDEAEEEDEEENEKEGKKKKKGKGKEGKKEKEETAGKEEK